MQTIYLSRRNLLTLLSKLDRAAAGEETQKATVKNDTLHFEYPCTDVTMVIAVEDENYYKTREPGGIVEADEKTVLMKKVN